MPKHQSLTQEQINEVPEADWYMYTLACGHSYYTRARIVVPRDYSYQENLIRCQKKHGTDEKPLEWKPIVGMKGCTNAEVSNVLDGSSFVLPGRILRSGNPNPFPYSIGKSRDY